MICVSTYEWMRPASSGSLEKSMPGTTCAVQKATCSVSAKKLSGLRFSTMRPTGCSGTSSSGMILVASRMSKLNCSACFLGEDLQAQLPLGVGAGLDAPPTGRGGGSRGRRRRSSPPRPTPANACPRMRRPVELDEHRFAGLVDQPEGVHAEALHRARSCAGWRGRDITHISMWVDSGISETKSQKVSCALAACGIWWCGSGLTAWTRSGNFIASWMKNTGMLLPTRSQLPSSV